MTLDKPLDEYTLEGIAELICGDDREGTPVYRSGSELTRFFRRTGLHQLQYDGSTRKWWTLDSLRRCRPKGLEAVILRLSSPKEYGGDTGQTKKAIEFLNKRLLVEGYQVTLSGVVPRIERVQPELPPESEEKEFRPLPPPDFLALGLEPGIGDLLSSRWHEAQKCVDTGAYLAATILMGSLLEGLLLGVLQRNPRIANQAPNSPKDPKTDKPKYFWDWKLAEMIDVAHEVGWLDLDVKKFSHSLREFRNLIHPYQQMATRCSPDEDTCGIEWLVVQAACNDLARVLQEKADGK